MNDMEANLVRLKAILVPEKPDDEQDPAGLLTALYSADVKLRWQGADWPWGGDMAGRDRLIACLSATSKLFVAPLEFWESTFWILDDERLLWWWRSRSTTFHGEPFSNSGLTILRFRDDTICEHWEYTDTEYVAHMFRGWRDLVDPGVGELLANWQACGGPASADGSAHT